MLPRLQASVAQGEWRGMTNKGEEKIFGTDVPGRSVPEQGAIGCVYTFEAHTELRRLENEVRMRDRLAAVGRLAAGIAHEIRNPLASISGSVQMLSHLSALTEEQRQLIDIVIRESKRLNSIITDFLAYSREKSYKFARADLIPLLEDALVLLEHRLHAGELRSVRHCSLSQAFAVADGDRMKQVFWNLLENAARAMDQKGTITVSVREVEDRWQISFRDTGSGIAPRLLEKILDRKSVV